MNLYMLELAVADPAASAAWYADRLGLRVTLRDPATGFTLLEAPGGRLALKPGTPTPGGVKLHFEVDDLPADAEASPEGYRKVTLRDPDGYAVVLFAFTSPGPARTPR